MTDMISLYALALLYVFIGTAFTVHWWKITPWWDRPGVSGCTAAILLWPLILAVRVYRGI